MKPFEFRASADGGEGELYIYGEIGNSWSEHGITPKQVADALKAMPAAKTVNVYINSPGGMAFDGMTIHNELTRHPAKVVTHVDGMAASAASIVAMAGDEIRMAANSLMMIHNASGLVYGPAKDMRKMADDLEQLDSMLVTTYAERTKCDPDKVKKMLDAETVMTAKEAKAMGFADTVTPTKNIAACACSAAILKALPESIRNLAAGNVPCRIPQPRPVLADKESTMPDDKTVAPAPQAPAPATLAELKGLKGSSAEFQIECLEKSLTLTQAQGLLIEQLSAKVDVADKALADAEAKAKTAAKTPGGPGLKDANGKRDVAPDGIEALVERDFMAAAQMYQAEHNIKSRTVAMSALARAYPEAHRRWIDSQPQIKTSGRALQRV